MEKNVSLLKVYTICFASMVVGATISPLITILINMGVDSSVIAFYRLLFLSILLVPYVFSKKKNRENLKNASKSAWFAIIGYSFCKAVGLFLWATALDKGGTAFLVGTLGNLSTVFIVIFVYIFLKEKTSKNSLLGIGICLAGVFTVALSNISQGLGGAIPVIIIVIASVFNAGNTIFGRMARKTVDFLPLITFGYALSCAMTGVIAFSQGASFKIDLKSGLLMAFLGCFSTLIAHSTPIWALKYARPASVSVINLASPFITAGFGFVLLNQIPSPLTAVGAVIMVIGLFYYVTNEQKENMKIKD